MQSAFYTTILILSLFETFANNLPETSVGLAVDERASGDAVATAAVVFSLNVAAIALIVSVPNTKQCLG